MALGWFSSGRAGWLPGWLAGWRSLAALLLEGMFAEVPAEAHPGVHVALACVDIHCHAAGHAALVHLDDLQGPGRRGGMEQAAAAVEWGFSKRVRPGVADVCFCSRARRPSAAG